MLGLNRVVPAKVLHIVPEFETGHLIHPECFCRPRREMGRGGSPDLCIHRDRIERNGGPPAGDDPRRGPWLTYRG